MYRVILLVSGLILFWLTIPVMAKEPIAYALQEPTRPVACNNCHAWRAPNLKRRELTKPHNSWRLKHGSDAIWCLDCHLASEPEKIKFQGTEILSFETSWQLCAVCHGRQVRDWQFGSHGKRVGNWQGVRTILSCSACHNVHLPARQPTRPATPPTAPPPTKPATFTSTRSLP